MDPLEVYVKADQFLVSQANKGVKAWNYVTGGTRAELASTMQLLGGAGVVASVAAEGYLVEAGIAGVGMAAYLALFRSQFQRVDTMESAAAGRGAKDLAVELQKKSYRQVGPVWPSIAICITSKNLSAEDGGEYMASSAAFFVGSVAQGAGFYIMRADYVEPQKNCLSRGFDKLSEIVRSYQPRPVLAPIRR